MSAKRALVIGSQTGGLTGVHSDAEVMEDALAALGFTTTRCIEADASHDELVARYRGLIEETTSVDVAVVYYSGHGGRQRNALAASDPQAPAWLQYLVPTDIDDRSGARFRGLLAQELSLLQLELTEKTANVTTILDCCHSARMSRGSGMLPKARPLEAAGQVEGFPWADLEARWAAVRAQGAAAPGAVDANPLAVRVVACSPDESAYELAETPLGGPHGALTSSLVPVLQLARTTPVTWRDVIDAVRSGVLDLVPQQRPELEGPLHRLVFSTEERRETGVLPVRIDAGAAVVDGADLFGMAVGDRYSLVAPGQDPSQPTATAVIDRIVGGRAHLDVQGAAVADLPAGVAAHPVEVSLGARPVAVLPLDAPARSDVVAELERSSLVRPVEEAVGVIGSVHIGDGLRLLDAAGEPLHEVATPISPDGIREVARDLTTLARATHVRELTSGRAEAELPDDVQVAYARLLPAGGEVAVVPSGEHLFAGDRLVVRCRNLSAETRYVSVVDVGISGAVTVLTSSEPDGATLAPQESAEIGRNQLGALEGIELWWPPTVPGTAPRAETVITIVADEKVAGLGRLEQPGVVARTRSMRRRSQLEALVEDLGTGRRDARPAAEPPRQTRYRVHRFDFLFHPEPRAGEVDEPAFDIEERPDPSFRLVIPRAARPPGRIAVRLKELTVHSNRSLLAAAVRIDALLVTVPPEGEGEPYRAATARFDRVKDGNRLPFDDLLVYEGPVGRFVDLAVWVAKDDHRELDLAELLAQETGGDEVKGAVATLAGLAVAAPQAALVAGSAAAVAVLVRTGARVLDALQGKSIGVYRTSLLPHERFGAGTQLGEPARHPTAGLLRAQDMSFAYEVVELEAPVHDGEPTRGAQDG